MRDFLSRHSYLIIWTLSLIIIGSLAVLILQLNTIVPAINSPTTHPIAFVAPVAGPPPAPPPPTVSVFIQKAKTGNSFVIQWQNLPGGTVALNIFRGKTGTDSTRWALWKTVSIAPDELGNGSATFNLGSQTEDGYSFYEQAEGGGGNGSSTGNGGGGGLWTSSSTVPTVTTSTPPVAPPENPGSPGNGNSPPQNNSGTASSTNGTGNNPGNGTSTGNGGGNSGGGSNSSTPNGIPYYNPQIQIEEYGNEPGSFWVQHVNQSIEIGWQDLPAGISSIVVARSENSSGPWNTILNQQAPGSSGSYSLQIVDDTLHDPYYYELTAFNGTTTVATYGPEYLAGQ